MLENDLVAILKEILQCDFSEKRLRAEIPQWDSMKHIEIIFALEDKYLIEFNDRELENLTSIDNILRILEDKIGGGCR